jgi:hypothetical protein
MQFKLSYALSIYSRFKIKDYLNALKNIEKINLEILKVLTYIICFSIIEFEI